MRSELISLLSEECDRQVRQSLPTFQLAGSPQHFGPGRLYVDHSESPVCFVYFQFSEKYDAFTVELAWSTSGVFPSSEGYRIPRDWPEIGLKRTDRDTAEFRFRLSKLWEMPKYDPSWEFFARTGGSRSARISVIADQQLDDRGKCAELVTDAIEKVQRFGSPYFAEVRNRAG